MSQLEVSTHLLKTTRPGQAAAAGRQRPGIGQASQTWPGSGWPGSQAEAFSRAIVRRYLDRWPLRAGLGFVFRREVRPAYTTLSTRLTLAPRLALNLFSPTYLRLAWTRPDGAGRAAPPVGPHSPAGPPASRLLLVQPLRVALPQPPAPGQVITTGRPESLVRYLTSRERRLEAVIRPDSRPRPETGPGRVVPNLPPGAAVWPVPRVVRRPAAAGPIPAENSPAPPGVISVNPQPPGMKQASPVAMDAVDLNRLTEQVVQNIDRRLLAYRERTGRI